MPLARGGVHPPFPQPPASTIPPWHRPVWCPFAAGGGGWLGRGGGGGCRVGRVCVCVCLCVSAMLSVHPRHHHRIRPSSPMPLPGAPDHISCICAYKPLHMTTSPSPPADGLARWESSCPPATAHAYHIASNRPLNLKPYKPYIAHRPSPSAPLSSSHPVRGIYSICYNQNKEACDLGHRLPSVPFCSHPPANGKGGGCQKKKHNILLRQKPLVLGPRSGLLLQPELYNCVTL